MVKTYVENFFKQNPSLIIVHLKNWELKGGLAIRIFWLELYFQLPINELAVGR